MDYTLTPNDPLGQSGRDAIAFRRDAAVLVTGARGLVGGATTALLLREGFTSLLTPPRSELDLTDPVAVNRYFDTFRPIYVLMIAGKVGGIAANVSDPVGFVDENVRISLNLFHACLKYQAEKALFLGSSCIYPASFDTPIPESALLTGPLEPTNEGYALSKIVGLRLASYYRHQHGLVTVCPMLSNVYGTGDQFDLQRSHVLSALVRRFVDARDEGADLVTLWGTGRARREFLHCDDAARAVLFFMDRVETSDHINIGPGSDLTIAALAQQVAFAAGYSGAVVWDHTKPDGMLRKCLDVSLARKLGFSAMVSLKDGIARTVREYEALKAATRTKNGR